MKQKFELTKKQIQLMMLGTSFLEGFMMETEDRTKYKDVQKMLNTLGKLSCAYKEHLKLELANAYKFLEKLTEGQDVEVNQLVFGLQCSFVFAEISDIDKALADKIFKVGMKIYSEVEKTQQGATGFRNANDLVAKFTDKIL